jgi:adenosylcobinamide-GDP ribazoletransferase
VLPLPARWRLDERHLARATPWFPLVGLALGAVLAGADHLLAAYLAQPARDALIVVGAIALTGALHVDGLMDTCDGYFAAVPPRRRLEIMRDSHVGSFGVTGVALLLLGKLSALASFGDAPRAAILLCVPLLGRWAMSLAVVCFPAGREEGLGRLVQAAARKRDLVLAGLISLGVCLVSLQAAGAIVWALVGLIAWLAGRGLTARLTGLTGDSYGALCELAELSALGLAPVVLHLTAQLGPPPG